MLNLTLISNSIIGLAVKSSSSSHISINSKRAKIFLRRAQKFLSDSRLSCYITCKTPSGLYFRVWTFESTGYWLNIVIKTLHTFTEEWIVIVVADNFTVCMCGCSLHVINPKGREDPQENHDTLHFVVIVFCLNVCLTLPDYSREDNVDVDSNNIRSATDRLRQGPR